MTTTSVCFQRENLRFFQKGFFFFILSYVEKKKTFYCVNKDKSHMLFHLLKFMVWV